MDAIEKARDFYQNNGRDIDRARFEYHFSSLPQSDLLDILGRYQNPDGGFAGLEFDIAAPQSNPFATELALYICLWAGVKSSHPLLQKTVAYLEANQDADGGWRFVPEIYQHQLAPWFQGWKWPNLNPACTLAGLQMELGLGSKEMLARVEQLFERMARVEDIANGEFYDVRPYAFYFIPDWPHPQAEFYRSGLVWWFIRQHAAAKMDATHFLEYIRSPQTYAGQALPARILNTWLDKLSAEQTEAGGWPSPYQANWSNWITVNNLLILKAFGRL